MYNVIHDTHVADYNMKREKFKFYLASRYLY